MKRNTVILSSVAAVLVTAASAALTTAAFAVEPTPAVEQPVTTTAPATTSTMLSLTEIERRLKTQGIRVTEIEVRDRVLEVEGYDSNNREVDLLVDRRTGEVLSRELDD